MASAGVALSGCKNNGSASIGTEKLQDWMNELKIRDDKKLKRPLLWERHRNWAHNVMATGGKNGQPKQIVSYMAERTVGQGSFGIVFQISCDNLGSYLYYFYPGHCLHIFYLLYLA